MSARPTSTRRGLRCRDCRFRRDRRCGVAQDTVRSTERALEHPALGGPAGGGSAEDHDVRVRSRRDDEPGSDRRAAPGARRGFSRRHRGARRAASAARSAHRAGTIPAVEFLCLTAETQRRTRSFLKQNSLASSRLARWRHRNQFESAGRRSTRTRSSACS